MGSQFVDLNADGHLDYLTATFDGSPHVSYGSEKGFGEPERLKDAEGRRVIISYIWNYDSRTHESVGRAMPDGEAVKERCISALAYDWDGDGDHDLLLGSYENGHLYRQMNEGTDAEPAYTGKNIPLLAGDKPFAIPGKMTAPRLVDWDGDGDLDLVAGSFGDSYGDGTGGGVYLSLNEGEAGKPAFGPLSTLIPPSQKGATEPTRPDAGLYVDPVDWEGDGDLDLLVGGYSMWKPPARELTAEEKETVAALREKRDKHQEHYQAIIKEYSEAVVKATKGLDRSSEEYQEKRTAVSKEFSSRLQDARAELNAVQTEIGKLVPAAQRKAFVWLYERQ